MRAQLRHSRLTHTHSSLALSGLGCLARDMACAMGFRTVMLGEHESMKQELNLGQDEWINISAVDAGHELQRMGGAKVVMCEYRGTAFSDV